MRTIYIKTYPKATAPGYIPTVSLRRGKQILKTDFFARKQPAKKVAMQR